jgi:hypothetical protein
VDLYIFPGNNPVNNTDPSGMISPEELAELEAYARFFGERVGGAGGQDLATLYWSLHWHEREKDRLFNEGKDISEEWETVKYFKRTIADATAKFWQRRIDVGGALYEAGTAEGARERDILWDLRNVIGDDKSLRANKFQELLALYGGGVAAHNALLKERGFAFRRDMMASIMSMGLTMRVIQFAGGAWNIPGAPEPPAFGNPSRVVSPGVPATKTVVQNMQHEQVAGYNVVGTRGLIGKTYQWNVHGLQGSGSLSGLVRAMEAEARAAGATRIQISGHQIENSGFFNARIAERYGFRFRQLDDKTILLEKVLE